MLFSGSSMKSTPMEGHTSPLVQSAAHRRRFQKAKAFVGGGAQHRHPSPLPFGSRGSHGRAAPLCICRSQKTVSKGGSLWRRRCAAPPSIAPSLREGVGGRAVTEESPLCSLPNENVFNMCSLHKVQKITKNFEKPIDISQKPWYNRIKIKELQHFIQAELPIGN